MVDNSYGIAYSEVLEILKYIPIEDYNKIPEDKIELFKINANSNYKFDYNPNKTLEEQNVSKIARGIIAILFRDYWATEFQKNKIFTKQNYDRQQLENQKREKYNPEDIFKNSGIKQDVKEHSSEEYTSNLPVEVKKQNIFQKLLSFIKKLIHH